MRAEATPERVAKLPAWAQHERRNYLHRIAELEAEVAALRAEPGALDANPFDIHVAVLDPYRRKVPAGEGHVEWTWPREGREKRLSARFIMGPGTQRPHVYINAAMGRLRIKPVATNALELELHDD